MEACKHCGKSNDKAKATCPHCGHTQWDMLIMTFVVGFGCLGAVMIVGEVDGPLYLATIFGLASATFLIMGLVWVKDLGTPPLTEEREGPPKDGQTTPAPVRHRVHQSPATRDAVDQFVEELKAREGGEAVQSEMVLFAYEGRGPEGLPGMTMPKASEEELKERIRRQASGAGLDVVIIPAAEWGAPRMSGVSVEVLTAALTPVMALVMVHMAKLGLPAIGPQELLRIGSFMHEPLTGVVFFIYRIDRPLELARKQESAQQDFARYDGTGACDVCNQDLTPGDAFLVPTNVFWDSRKYKEWFAATPQGLVTVQMGATVDQHIATLRRMDKSKHSAVCPECIHLFR